MSANFKTCMFGGFDREDVIRYIEKTAKETQERIEALEQENEALRGEKEKMEAALRALHSQTKQLKQDELDQNTVQQQLEDAQAQIAALKEANAELTLRNDALADQNEKLRPVAEECRALKERIADIEICAHRRTEEFRAEAVAKLRESIAAQRAWCQERRGQYTFMNERLLCDLHRAEDILENGDMSGFDRMLEGLQQLEDSLQ